MQRETAAQKGYENVPTFGGYQMSGLANIQQGQQAGQNRQEIQTGQNTPPGLHTMPSGFPKGDDNLSFFTKGQLNPGVIQPPKREADSSTPQEQPTKRPAYQQNLPASNVPQTTPQRITSSER